MLVEPHAVVFHQHGQPAAGILQLDMNVLGLSVARAVGEAFLHDAIEVCPVGIRHVPQIAVHF